MDGVRLCALVLVVTVGGVSAQSTSGLAMPRATVQQTGGSDPVAVLWEPTPQELAAYRELQAARLGYERELKKIRARFFRGVRNPEIREIGMRRLSEYTDPAAFELLADLFFEEGPDARAAVLGHLASLETGEADAAIAWQAVYAEDAEDRAASLGVLESIAEDRGVSDFVVDVTRSGLYERDETPVVAASQVASSLKLYELIPQIAAAQVAVGGGGNERRGDLAWIFVGTQRTFVSDVQPVVSDGAVAFDPQLSVVSEGVILRVHDAYVAIYRVAVHEILLGMSSEAWGRSTAHLGYDLPAWRAWYDEEFVPYLAAQAEAEGEPAQP